jgi:predicted GNAT family acetyltransferase
MIKLSEELYKTGLTLKLMAGPDWFKQAYNSPYVKGPPKFYGIHSFIDAVKVGEIEYGDVDDNTIEIVSIFVLPMFRGRGYAQQAVNQLINITKKKTVMLMPSSSSKVFWKKFGFTPLQGASSSKYLTKTF